MRDLARSDLGQSLGGLYATLGMSDPREFGDLPCDIRQFWIAWWNKRRGREQAQIDRLLGGM